MGSPIIKTSFAGGELAPSLNGRVDLTKYGVGASVMRNFFVDFRGGASTRPGTAAVLGRCRIIPGAKAPRGIPFQFSSEQSYGLELNDNRMRVVSNGGYVLETTKSITGVALTTTLVLTVTAHGWAAGDFIFVSGVNGVARANGASGVNGRVFYVIATTTNTVTLADVAPLSAGVDYAAVDPTGWSAWTSGGTAARIYEITTPWNDDVLFELNFTQSADVMTVVHPDFPVYDIARLGNTNWTITQQTFGATLPPPSGFSIFVAGNNPANQQYTIFYVVTTVDSDGRESNASGPQGAINQNLNQNSSPAVTNTLVWGAVSGAAKYRVYKALPIPTGSEGAGPFFYGLVSEVYDSRFTDVNYEPDFATTPPQLRNPFANSSLAAVQIVNGGSGYVSPYAVITDAGGAGASVSLGSDLTNTASPYGEVVTATVIVPGTGYVAPTVAVLDAAPPGSGLALTFNGVWIANPLGTGFVPGPGSITVLNGGTNYHAATYSNFVEAVALVGPIGTNKLRISVTQVVGGSVTLISYAAGTISPTPTTGLSSTGTGGLTFTIVGSDVLATGATATATIGGGDNPSCVSYLDQRRVFAASRSRPSTFFASKTGQFTNFDVSDPPQDDDAITGSIFAEQVNIIGSLVPVTNGLMALTSGGAFLISGGGSNAPITPATAQAPPQAFNGAQPNLQPLRINDHVIYAQARGTGVRDLAYNFYSNNFTGQDISVLSQHLLEGRRIVQWAYAEEPLKLAWAVRDDGVLLSLTYLKEQEVYGWARHDTQGRVASVFSIPEGREDAVYIIVHRYNPGYGFRYVTERMASRLYGANEAANIKAQPELAWCSDGGAQYPLTRPNTNILEGVQTAAGTINVVEIGSGGTGYTAPILEVEDATGSGAIITATQTAGVITSVTIVSGGEGYTSPRIVVRDPAAAAGGADLAASVANLFTFTFAAAAFSALDIDKVLRVRGGRGVVVSSPATNQLVVNMTRAPACLPNLAARVVPPVAAGDWSLTAPVSIIGGLDMLNGSTVQVLADGGVQAPRVVVDGCITLDAPATCIIVGQGFTAQLRTMRPELPQMTAQGQDKLINDVVLRIKDTRGVFIGSAFDRMVEVKERRLEPMGSDIEFQTGGELLEPAYEGAPTANMPVTYDDKFVNIAGNWTTDGYICIQQSYPLPATVLALVPNVTRDNP